MDFSSTLESKLREKENFLEAKIHDKVDATVSRIKEIVHQKLILISALKNALSLSAE
jgi:hypothetical protein